MHEIEEKALFLETASHWMMVPLLRRQLLVAMWSIALVTTGIHTYCT